MLTTRKFSLLFFVWMVFVTWASLATFPDEGTPGIDIPHFDKVVHFCFYFVAAVLGALSVREIARGRTPITKTLVFVAFGVIVFGIIIEGLQYGYTTERQGDPYDIAANSLGAFGGAMALKWLFSGGSRLKWG
ncbi:MAG TPA: VanZ family protein [Pricia sp.]|nr:VanZ family protein [Pricia sp.]